MTLGSWPFLLAKYFSGNIKFETEAVSRLSCSCVKLLWPDIFSQFLTQSRRRKKLLTNFQKQQKINSKSAWLEARSNRSDFPHYIKCGPGCDAGNAPVRHCCPLGANLLTQFSGEQLDIWHLYSSSSSCGFAVLQTMYHIFSRYYTALQQPMKKV